VSSRRGWAIVFSPNPRSKSRCACKVVPHRGHTGSTAATVKAPPAFLSVSCQSSAISEDGSTIQRSLAQLAFGQKRCSQSIGTLQNVHSPVIAGRKMYSTIERVKMAVGRAGEMWVSSRTMARHVPELPSHCSAAMLGNKLIQLPGDGWLCWRRDAQLRLD